MSELCAFCSDDDHLKSDAIICRSNDGQPCCYDCALTCPGCAGNPSPESEVPEPPNRPRAPSDALCGVCSAAREANPNLSPPDPTSPRTSSMKPSQRSVLHMLALTMAVASSVKGPEDALALPASRVPRREPIPPVFPARLKGTLPGGHPAEMLIPPKAHSHSRENARRRRSVDTTA